VDEVTGAMGVAEEAAAGPSGGAAAPSGDVADLAAVAGGPTGPTGPTGEAAGDEAGLAPSAQAADPWAPLLEAGLQWVTALTAPATPGAAVGSSPRITTDRATGERSLSIPLPDPATLARLAQKLSSLLAQFQR